VTVHAAIGLTLGTLDLDVELDVGDGEVVALLGPNGAGKSTILRVLAGLLAIDRGAVDIGGVVVDDPARRILVPPERRPVGVVFQDYLLFQNLSALENVAFGLRARGMARGPARTAAHRWLDLIGLGEFARHRPGQLSGGQAQRVALVRALATEPRLLLLDEPLAALDVGTRSEVRRELRRVLAGVDGARILVTHDPVDAHALADRVVVLEQGRIVQQGALADVTAHPKSRYVADLVGVNLLPGIIRGGVLTTAAGAEIVATGEVSDGEAFVAIRPSAVAIYVTRPDGSPRNVWAATVADIDEQADRVRVRVDGAVPLVAEITRGALESLALRPGDAVWASAKALETLAYPA
jgi:molybdate transport system ATP-binding protein